MATGFGWAEGPADDGDGGIWFTDLASPFPTAEPKRILRYDIETQVVAVMDSDSGGSNGLAFDATGTLITADGDMQRVTRRPVGTDMVVLADSWMETPLNGPNDIVIDSQGGIFFTDPNYFHDEQAESVYYLGAGFKLQRLASGLSHPNGIALSPDERTLYVAEEESNRVLAFDLDDDRRVTSESVFATGIHPDGMTIDRFGNVYISGLGAFDVTVWNPTGQRILTIPIGEWVANVGLAGEHETDLYVTAQSSLYHVPLRFVSEVLGDFNNNGTLDSVDIDLLSTEIRKVPKDPRFDVNGDRLVNKDDHTFWVKDREVMFSYLGDANLDGEFNSGDLVAVFEAGKFERDIVASWSEGDWNGDGRCGTGDLVTAFEDGGYERGPRMGVNAVPEPASILIFVGGLIGIAFCHRRNGR